MKVKLISLIPVLALLAIAQGCRTPLSRAPIGLARAVADVPGVKNLTRDGGIFFAGQPTRGSLEALADRGVRTVINLRPDREMATRVDFDEPRSAEDLGMSYVTIPFTSATLSAGDADRLHEILGTTTGGALIHCGSSNRVGALWALYLHRHRGIELDDAIALGKRAGLSAMPLIEAVRREAKE